MSIRPMRVMDPFGKPDDFRPPRDILPVRGNVPDRGDITQTEPLIAAAEGGIAPWRDS